MRSLELDVGTIEIEIDDAPRELMLEKIEEEVGEGNVKDLLSSNIQANVAQFVPINAIISELYDNRDQLDPNILEENNQAAEEVDFEPVE